MPQAIVDPDDVRQFAQNLKRFNDEVRDRMKTLQSQLQGLSATWRDQEQRKFTEEFQVHSQHLVRFVETNEHYLRFLARKIAHIDEYLQS
ncbi:MAG: WXG100 family type VII secretion target [Pirellulales bacterium]